MHDSHESIYRPPTWWPAIVMLQGAPQAGELPMRAFIEGIAGSLVDTFHDRVLLITSRTQLRESIRAIHKEGVSEELPRVQRILGGSDVRHRADAFFLRAVHHRLGHRGIEPRRVERDPIDGDLDEVRLVRRQRVTTVESRTAARLPGKISR